MKINWEEIENTVVIAWFFLIILYIPPLNFLFTLPVIIIWLILSSIVIIDTIVSLTLAAITLIKGEKIKNVRRLMVLSGVSLLIIAEVAFIIYIASGLD